MSKDLSKKLSELRDLLPYGYRKQILELTENVSINDIKRAFAGTLTNQKKLIAILVATKKLMHSNAKLMEKADSLIETVKQVAA